MARRTRNEANGLRDATAKLDGRCIAKAREIIERYGVTDYDVLLDALMRELAPVCKLSSQTAAQLALAAYQRWRKRDIGATLIGAVAKSAWSEEKFQAACATAAAAGIKNGAKSALNVMASRIGYDNRASKTATLASCAQMDDSKPRFARVPADDEACDFCMMLASRGFEYFRKTSGESGHNHTNCRCEYMASWDESPKADGYDADAWYGRWQESVEQTAKERAERNGTTAAEEKKAIMRSYSEASKRAYARARKH